MTKVYFLGGEDIAERNSKEINEKAFTDSGGSPAVLVFPWTAESVDRTIGYNKMTADYFADLGARSVEFVELSDSLQEIAERMSASDLIYLPGGDTKLLLARMIDSKVDSLIREYRKVIIGNSAGALALSKNYVVVRGEDGETKAEAAPGLGLVDFGITVHYRMPSKIYSGRSLDNELESLSQELEMAIYAIPETCALICSDGSLSFVGSVYLFQEGKRTKCE
jgi:peptidase E